MALFPQPNSFPGKLSLLLLMVPATWGQCYQFVSGDKTLTINVTNPPPPIAIGASAVAYNLAARPGNSMAIRIGSRDYSIPGGVITIFVTTPGATTSRLAAIAEMPGFRYGVGLHGYASALPLTSLPPTLPPLSAWAPFGGAQITTQNDWDTSTPKDQVFFDITSMGGCPASVLNQPQFEASGAIVNGASFQAEFASGTWLTIRGTKLASTTRTWQASDFNGRALPTALDGVQVKINNRLAYIYYISPTQLNVLAPDDPVTGPVPVQVITRDSASAIVTVNKSPVAPAFFSYSAQSGRYVIAQDAVSYALLGPPGLLGAGVVTTPARPGENITLYATGLGATTPATNTGETVVSALPVAAPVQVTIGGQPAAVAYAGLIGSGLYQVNVVVPALLPGDARIELRTGTGRSQTAFLAVGSP
jgi:uncharacterized protein (TIGR03437 family)